MENLAMCDYAMMEKYLEGEGISEGEIQSAIQKRQVFPCYFGSALKIQGVEEFLDGFEKFTLTKTYPNEFGAKI